MPMPREFENPDASFGPVSAALFARVLGSSADVAFVLDADSGTIRDVSFGSGDLAQAGLSDPVGRRLIDLVTTESRPKVEALMSGDSPAGRWRHLNFPTDADDLPISVQAFGLDGGRLLVIGRDERQAAIVQRRFVAAQRELEASHARLRQADMRFHTILELADAAVVTLDGDTLDVLDANRAATEQLPGGRGGPVGQNFLSLVARELGPRVQAALAGVTASGRPARIDARLRDGAPIAFQAALFRYERSARLLLRLLDGEPENEPARALIAEFPHGIVVTTPDLRIAEVNRAFVDLAQLSVAENALGQPLDRFLGRNGVDTDILAASLREGQAVRGFSTMLVDAFGNSVAIELDAVPVHSGDGDCWGFFLREGSSERAAPRLGPSDKAGIAERMSDAVGRVSLKDIVRDTTDQIERLCIETALGMTDGNRAAAADMLGISRQSLYVKLARYGIGEDEE